MKWLGITGIVLFVAGMIALGIVGYAHDPANHPERAKFYPVTVQGVHCIVTYGDNGNISAMSCDWGGR